MNVHQLPLAGLDVPPDEPTPRRRAASRPADTSVAELSRWARRQVSWIAQRAHADRSSEVFLYTQAAKLVEELGELHAQLLGRSRQQRKNKSGQFTADSLAGEFADVLICTAILADVAGVNLADAVQAKMAAVDARVAAGDVTPGETGAATDSTQS